MWWGSRSGLARSAYLADRLATKRINVSILSDRHLQLL